MEFYNNLAIKVTENKIFFPVVISVFYLIYLISAGSTPFGDDYVYIFKNSHVTSTNHPFVFWDLTSDSYKAWPLTYSVFWLLFKVFGTKVLLYRLVNASIHLLNAYLLKNLCDRSGHFNSKFIFLLFLFHPLAVENIFWIFQLKTLLATTFIILAFRYINTSVHKSFWLFAVSLFTKSIGILFPVLIPTKNRSIKHNILILIPFISLSIYVGIQNIKGVTASGSNTLNVREFYSEAPDYRADEKKMKTTSELQSKRDQLSLSSRYIDYFVSFLPNQMSLEVIGMKSLNFFSHLGFYVKSSLGLTKNWLVYPPFSKLSHFINIIFCFGFLTVFILFKPTRKYLLASMLFFIPTSGLFYVTYMEHSSVADHWFYTSLAFFLLALSTFDMKKQKIFLSICSLLLILLVGQTLSNNIRLNKTRDYFFENLSETPKSKILLEYLIQIEIEKRNYRSAEILSFKLLAEAHNKVPIFKTLLFLHYELKDLEGFNTTKKRYFSYLDSLGLQGFKMNEMKLYSLPR